MVDLPDQLWAWETLRQGDEAKVCNDAKSKAEVWFDKVAKWDGE